MVDPLAQARPAHMNRSLLYSNIHVYRFVMNVLYRGAYRQRFRDVLELIRPEERSLCELCFGDTFIAEWCRSHNMDWTGVDINHGMVQRARRLGFNAVEGDVAFVDLPDADVYVIVGSLYHFYRQIPELVDRIFRRTSRLILSEPVQNLSSRPGVIGWLAGRSANPGTGHATFRYNRETLLAAVDEQRQRKNFTLRIVSSDRDLLMEVQR